MLRAAAILLALATFASAQEGAPSPEFLRRAAQWLQAPEAQKRKAAYTSFLQLGPEAMPAYETALKTALGYHTKALDNLTGVNVNATNPYLAHSEAAGQLDAERIRVLELIRTDWKKDGDKVRMLRDEMKSLAKLHKRVLQLASADAAGFDKALDGSVSAIAEITREMLRFHPDESLVDLDDKEMRRHVLDQRWDGEEWMKRRDRLAASRAEVALLTEVTRANNAAGRWSTPAMKDFAVILNAERNLVGLTPLRIEEKLSAAAKGHSSDMASRGFFAHESPVEGKKSPWDRASLAGFKGNASGENIFMGSASPAAAYDGWFGSDGHRFIMFGQGPNVLGVGVSGSHWTMMTGSL